MKRNLLKAFTMLMLLVVLSLASAVASAQTPAANKVVASVPFEFSVGYKTMPAGDYSVQIIATANDALMIKNADSSVSALRLSEATSREKDKSHARLIFNRYGDKYFLSEVWNGVDKVGRRLIKSDDERAAEADANANREAAHASYERVEVAALLR
jgi:methionine-rich copper-binding protein CopC